MVLVGKVLSKREAHRDTNPDNVSVSKISGYFHQSLPVKTESQAQGIPLAASLDLVPHAKTQEKGGRSAGQACRRRQGVERK